MWEWRLPKQGIDQKVQMVLGLLAKKVVFFSELSMRRFRSLYRLVM